MLNWFKKKKQHKQLEKKQIESIIIQQFGLLDDKFRSDIINIPSEEDINMVYRQARISGDSGIINVKKLAGELYKHYRLQKV